MNVADHDRLLEPGIGRAVRRTRLRAGLTQVQLARAISRSGKFLSEVETGKARITRRDLERLADAMGVSSEKVLGGEEETATAHLNLPRRIRDIQPGGLTILSLTQLLTHLDRSGWLRSANLWMIGGQPFPEENDITLVEQIAALVSSKNVSLRYVFPADRMSSQRIDMSCDRSVQGTVEALPSSLRQALQWSNAMRACATEEGDRVIGYALESELPELARSHTLLWVETDDVSWSEVMPLLYCRAETRTFENPNENTAFWYHVPRVAGSNLLLELAQMLRAVGTQEVSST